MNYFETFSTFLMFYFFFLYETFSNFEENEGVNNHKFRDQSFALCEIILDGNYAIFMHWVCTVI